MANKSAIHSWRIQKTLRHFPGQLEARFPHPGSIKQSNTHTSPLDQKRLEMVPEPRGVCFKVWVMNSRNCFRNSPRLHIGDVLRSSESDPHRQFLQLFWSALLGLRKMRLWPKSAYSTHPKHPSEGSTLMMIAFITINSGFVPLFEGLCAQILFFKICDYRWFAFTSFAFLFRKEKYVKEKRS